MSEISRVLRGWASGIDENMAEEATRAIILLLQ
jgi:hypothetical protein